MSFSEIFIHRPVATWLLTIAIALAGGVAFRLLPVSPLPEVDFPTISVSASIPGASPETMASSVATPLERQFGRIAGVTEMTSSSGLGSSSVTLQFELDRNIDAAGRDVLAAINAARGNLPANLPSNPSYRKVNPADSPIYILALTSERIPKTAMYDAASTVVAQKLSQIPGVGQVTVGGSSLPAVRIELNPQAVHKYGIGFEQIRTVLASANANTPKGHLSYGSQTWEIGANDQIFKASEYTGLIVAYRNGAAVRISDVGQAVDGPEDLRNAGYTNGKPSIPVIVFRQPGANIIRVVDRLRQALPQLQASIPAGIEMKQAMDQTVTIRASVREVEWTLLISIALVLLVVFLFLRNVRTTFIPSVAVPVSLIGTFGVMYLLDYSLDNLSLMALTISTGFVVDDAIVVIENITRYLEQGMSPMEAASKGAREIGFTVLSISISLIAVFIPLLLMGGLVGRLFREFAVTLSIAILLSMVISLTTTPMMCAHLLKQEKQHGWLYRKTEQGFTKIVDWYGRSLQFVLRHSLATALILLATIALNVYLVIRIPKGFFPIQDTGRLNGNIRADQDTSFEQMDQMLKQFITIINQDPAVDTAIGQVGGGRGGATNSARVFISLKPLNQRKVAAPEIIARLRPKLSQVAGAQMFINASQDLRIGGRQSNAEYQFTLRSDSVEELTKWGPKMQEVMRRIPVIADVNSDLENHGQQVFVAYDRQTAARFGISPQLIDNTLYDAFGQRPVSNMYSTLNQYHVIMEAAPQYWRSPLILRDIYVHSPTGADVPLTAFARFAPEVAALSVAHQGLFPSNTISFNLREGAALGDAVNAVKQASVEAGLPANVQTVFSGTAEAYQESLESEPWLIAAAIIAVYLVLGILYESTVHPITILSTLPSAGVGALLALLLARAELTIIAMIGIVLLIGIVKKNAILMIDFALAAERNEHKSSRDAIYEACMLRFRPILMTTMAAMLGAFPLALGTGTGSELRRPLGIAIIGGLVVSQMLTLFTTPVVYLYFDRLRTWWSGARTQEGPVESHA